MFQVFFLGFTSGCLIGFIGEWFWKHLHSPDEKNAKEKQVPHIHDDEGKTYKLALIVNKELKMGDGKVVAQCSHAAVGTYESYFQTHRSNFDTWERQGKRVSVFKVSDTLTLKSLYKSADARGMITCLVKDAGFTQIAPGSTTVLAIGPEDESVLNSMTEYLLPYP